MICHTIRRTTYKEVSSLSEVSEKKKNLKMSRNWSNEEYTEWRITRFIVFQSDKTLTMTCWICCCRVVILHTWLRQEICLNLVDFLIAPLKYCDFNPNSVTLIWNIMRSPSEFFPAHYWGPYSSLKRPVLLWSSVVACGSLRLAKQPRRVWMEFSWLETYSVNILF
jgi:hypothetical protein